MLKLKFCLSLQVCKQSETAASGAGKENPKMEQHPMADNSEDIKEHVIEEESSTNEFHPESPRDETTNEVISVIHNKYSFK